MPEHQWESLQRELESLRQAMNAALLTQSGRTEGQHLALVRLCRGLSPEMWMELGLHESSPDLLALPLSGDLFPHVARLASLLDGFAAQKGLDKATALPGPEAFDRQLDGEIERAVRTKSSLSLALLRLSDSNGAALGTELAVRIAELMMRSTRRYDMAARLSEGEFALLLPGAGMYKTRILLERIIGDVDVMEAAQSWSICAGIASIKGIVRVSPKDMLELAKEALEKTGLDGESRVVTAPIPDIGLTTKATLVQASEKLFLFGGV